MSCIRVVELFSGIGAQVYLIMAFVGLYNWWKLNKLRNPDNQ